LLSSIEEFSMSKLTTAARKALPTSDFALPGKRKFPVEDKAHAEDAKSRATQGVKRGSLTPAQASKIRAKADRMLGGQK
jgi:hypothetical protein